MRAAHDAQKKGCRPIQFPRYPLIIQDQYMPQQVRPVQPLNPSPREIAIAARSTSPFTVPSSSPIEGMDS